MGTPSDFPSPTCPTRGQGPGPLGSPLPETRPRLRDAFRRVSHLSPARYRGPLPPVPAYLNPRMSGGNKGAGGEGGFKGRKEKTMHLIPGSDASNPPTSGHLLPRDTPLPTTSLFHPHRHPGIPSPLRPPIKPRHSTQLTMITIMNDDKDNEDRRVSFELLRPDRANSHSFPACLPLSAEGE